MTPQRRVPGDVLVHLRRARDHLDRHFAEPFDLDHLAALAGVEALMRDNSGNWMVLVEKRDERPRTSRASTWG